MEKYKGKFIGEKQIEKAAELEEKTTSGIAIISVEFVDGTHELLSALMLDKTVTEEACDLSTLRDKRVQPVVEEVLKLFRDWGLKLNELGYLSTLMVQSLEYSDTQAMLHLWSKEGVKLQTPQDVDLLTLDRVLKEVKPLTMDDVLNKPKTE